MIRGADVDQSGWSDQTFDSWALGWRSLLLRRLTNRAVVDEMVVPPLAEQRIILATRGEVDIESGASGHWRRGVYRPGQIGMTAPGLPTRLRWRTLSAERSESLVLYLPAATISRQVEELWDRDPARATLPDTLATTDPVLEQMMLGLQRAAETGSPDLYAETAAEFIAVHLLTRHGPIPIPSGAANEDRRVWRARDFMRENLHRTLSLAEIAAEAGLSRYHFLRVFRQQTGETPHRHLTRLRVGEGRRELERGALTVTEVAQLTGFANPAHFAAVFRREMGVTPSAYRRAIRRSTT